MPEELNPAQVEELRADLLALQAQLEGVDTATRSAARPVELDAPIGRLSRMDAIQQQSMSSASRRRNELRLRQVLAALARIREDEYGACRRCGEPIGYRRLKARPETPMCMRCTEAAERR